MSYGKLSAAQRKILKPVVQGVHLHDLGAGECDLSRELLKLGAEHITAVDSSFYGVPAHRKITQAKSLFRDYVGKIDAAFISWPINNSASTHLIRLLKSTPLVIYLGKNSDGWCCGSPDFFRHLAKRIIVEHVPEIDNTLTIYGQHRGDSNRLLTGEEIGGINTQGPWTFAMTEELARAGIRYNDLEKALVLPKKKEPKGKWVTTISDKPGLTFDQYPSLKAGTKQ